MAPSRTPWEKVHGVGEKDWRSVARELRSRPHVVRCRIQLCVLYHAQKKNLFNFNSSEYFLLQRGRRLELQELTIKCSKKPQLDPPTKIRTMPSFCVNPPVSEEGGSRRLQNNLQTKERDKSRTPLKRFDTTSPHSLKSPPLINSGLSEPQVSAWTTLRVVKESPQRNRPRFTFYLKYMIKPYTILVELEQ